MNNCSSCRHFHPIQKHDNGRTHGECSVDIPFWAMNLIPEGPSPWIIWEDEDGSENCDCYEEKP